MDDTRHLTLTTAKKTLAEQWQILLIHAPHTGVPGGRVSPESLLPDGRSRKKLLAELVKEGYLSFDNDTYRVTSKAWDEVPAVLLDLPAFYKFDEHSARQNANHYVTFDTLSLSQRKAVVTHPDSYQLMFTNERHNPAQITPFKLGEGGEAREKTGGWHDARLVVTSEAVVQLHKAAQRANYKTKCLYAGLNWFLKENHANTEDHETLVDVPVAEKQPFFGGHIALNSNPACWEENLPAVIAKTEEEVREAQARLRALLKLEKTVDLMGGWPAFLAKYDAAIDAYVTENLDKP